MKFYSSVAYHPNGKDILINEIDEGKRVKRKLRYKPYLFVSSNENSKWKTLDGKEVKQISFENMRDAKSFLKDNQNVNGFSIYGMTNFLYPCINDVYPGKIEYDISKLVIVPLDIEVKVDIGFPNIEEANNEITAITISRNGFKHVFGCDEYKEHLDNVKYYRCTDEKALLKSFLGVWKSWQPDIVTGWNIEFFDIPYLINRIIKVLGKQFADELSPWEMLSPNTIYSRGKKIQTYKIVGMSVLDYFQLYQKFTYSKQESYKLDYIAEIELKERKLDYSEYGTLEELRVKNFQKYIEYNIHDVTIVEKLDEKMQLIALICAIAYDAKINLEDAFGSVKPWDVIIHNFLLDRNIVIPMQEEEFDVDDIVGGFVKTPVTGLHKWLVSFDFTSLYPHLIMACNISPETFMKKLDIKMSIDDILDGKLEPVKDFLKSKNACITPNLCLYSKEKLGFLPALMSRMYNDRNLAKKKYIEAKIKFQETKESKFEFEMAKWNNFQMALKILLNSAYGAIGNKFFRFFNVDNAEAITSGGQLSIRWIDKWMNQFLNKILKTKDIDYVIASDTDSIYIGFDKLVEKLFGDKGLTDNQIAEQLDKFCKKIIQPEIDKICMNLGELTNMYDSSKLNMKRECIASKGIWVAKKKYVLHMLHNEDVVYDKPELKIMGLEAVKSSTPNICRKKIKEAFELILTKSESDLQEFIQKFKEEFNKSKFEEVAFPRGVNGMKKYSDAINIFSSGTPIHTKGALIYNHILKRLKLDSKYQEIADGDKIKFCYLKIPNMFMTPVISILNDPPVEFNIEHMIDYETQFQKGFIIPLKAVTDHLGWELVKINSLGKFFND